jgi:ATP-dependent Clp protease ATP-binding subunit ClpA
MSTQAIKTERKLRKLDATTRGAADRQNESIIRMNVVGQDGGVQAALDAVARSRNPLRDMNRPVSIIYLLGPSRTGKTLIARMIAKLLHGNEEALTKINGGNYKEKHQVAQLIGAPPGYLGHKPGDDEEGNGKAPAGKKDKHAKLTQRNLDASRMGSDCPVSVVLIDEANLMHGSFDDVLMSICDDGQLDMGNNDVTDFRQTIIILTSNLGMDEVARKASKRGIGFINGGQLAVVTDADVEKTVKDALRDRYRPEWLNRIDNFIIFKKHGQSQLESIVDMELEKFVQRMEKQLPRGTMFHIDVETSAKKFLLDSSLADGGNIANLKRELQKHIIDGLGNLLQQKAIGSGETVIVAHEAGQSVLSFYVDEDAKPYLSAADRISVRHESDENQDGLAMQRRLERAVRPDVVKREFDIILTGRTEQSMIRSASGLMKEVRDIYGMTVVRHSYASRKPWTFVLTVEAAPAQIDVFTSKETEAKVVAK